MSRTPKFRTVTTALAATALAATAGLASAPAATAGTTSDPTTRAVRTVVAAGPYERGPAPTNASIEAARGPFAIAQVTVAASVTPGFGAATIYYPTDTSQGTFGGVAVVPGFTNTQSAIAWYGPRLASQGFVVMTFDTQSRFDSPSARGDQLRAALDYLTTSSSVRTRVDATRLAVMGYSMGGGGALEAAKDRPGLQAAIPLAGYNTDKTWPEVRTPTFVIGAQSDTVAPVRSHSIPFYDSLTNAVEKAYLELAGASHSAPTSPNTTIAKYSISWLKRYVDDDLRYEQFLCPGPQVGGAVSAARNTCPGS
jgi:dienelactone hydrolase